MPFLKSKLLLILNLLLLLCVLGHAVYRDIQLEKQYPGDLRNRVVGARMQKDGRSPYFYKWAPGDDYRYIDPQNEDSLKVANITASPVLHDLIMPIAFLPQRAISILWLCLQYILLALVAVLFVRLCHTFIQKQLVINCIVFFTLTEAWKSVTGAGQLYFITAFFMACTIYGLLKREKKVNIWLAIFSTALLILIRPIALVLFVPFIVQYKNYVGYAAGVGMVLFIYAVFAFIYPSEKKYWKDYVLAMQEQVKIHQDAGPTLQQNARLPKLTTLEGFDFNEVQKNTAAYPIVHTSENGNAFVVYRQLFHQKLSVSSMSLALAVIVLSILCGFVYYNSRYTVSAAQIIIIAFVFYMLAEIFSPVYRHQYNAAQWLPVLLTGILLVKKHSSVAGVLLWLGLLLNIANSNLLPMRHTLGELCWIIGLLLIAFTKPSDNLKWKLR